MFRVLTLASFVATLAVAVSQTAVAAVTETYQWVQFGPADTVLLRWVSSDPTAACAVASVDGVPVTLTQRFDPSSDTSFPIKMCETSVSAFGHTSATVDGVPLKMPVSSPHRIVIVGDTGCRLKGTANQACNDPAAFPLARISAYIQSFQPDLIVHTGDFYYREGACPYTSESQSSTAGFVDCVGSPHGEIWASWDADWFNPAKQMMLTAPLALTRGNHESCARGAKGWFHLLAVQPWATPYSTAGLNECLLGSAADFTPSYVVKAGSISLVMFDNSFANTTFSTVAETTYTLTDGSTTTPVATYNADLTASLKTISGSAVIVAHKPTYGLVSQTGTTITAGGVPDIQAIFPNGTPSNVKMFWSGHIHNFAVTQFNNANYAPQLVVGVSGTLLDPQYIATPDVGGVYNTVLDSAGTVKPVALKTTYDTAQFGFAVLDVVPGGFIANNYDTNGSPHGRCVIQVLAKNISCSN